MAVQEQPATPPRRSETQSTSWGAALRSRVMPHPFEVSSEQPEPGVRVFKVLGELDMNTAPELDRRLNEALAEPETSIMLDLAGCEFIDSTGIALIVRAWQRLDRNGGGDGSGRFVVCCINHQVRRLLRITGVESSISVHEERDAALAELRS